MKRDSNIRLLKVSSALLLPLLAVGLCHGSIQPANADQDAAAAPQVDHTPPQPVPTIAGLKVLFGGTADDLKANWLQKGKPAKWDIEDGALIASGPDSIETATTYTDYQLHLEFREPYLPNARGQSRGNSGVFMQGRYEIQILDSFGISDPGSGDCGGVYSIAAPLVNACKAPLQWQTYDIYYRAPRVEPGTKTILEYPRVTVIHNGILIQNQVAITSTTHQTKAKPGETPKPRTLPGGFETPGPISLQWHGNRIAFRNIWIVPLALQGAQHY